MFKPESIFRSSLSLDCDACNIRKVFLRFLLKTWILSRQRWTSNGKKEKSMLQVIVGFVNNDISTNTAPSSLSEEFTTI